MCKDVKHLILVIFSSGELEIVGLAYHVLVLTNYTKTRKKDSRDIVKSVIRAHCIKQ